VFVESQTPYKVCGGEAGYGTEAIEKARDLQPDLILLDFSLPSMTGAEAATVIKGMMPRTKIILFSMHFDYVPRSLTGGVDLTLSKIDGITKLGEHFEYAAGGQARLVPRNHEGTARVPMSDLCRNYPEPK
jgi:DNA-binding NarL/FixJ family response regulator